MFRALGAEALPRGAHVRVKVTGTDLLTLDVHASVIARLDDEPPSAALRTGDDADDDDRRQRRPADAGHRRRGDVTEGRRRRPSGRRADNRSAGLTLRILRQLSTLQLALIVSIGVHAGLLTVRIVDPEGFNRIFQDTPLEVILVNSRSGEAPEKAQAIAQANLAGGGDAAEPAARPRRCRRRR